MISNRIKYTLSILLAFLMAANVSATADSSKTTGDSLLVLWDQQINDNFRDFIMMEFDSTVDYRSPEIDSLVRHSINDSILKLKFDTLNASSPIDLVYNEVVADYVRLYLVKRKQLTSSVLSRMGFYFAFYEPMLDKYNLPLELKYLSIIESALNQEARSWAGASGLWQFMSGTARLYDLHVGAYVDERYDMYKATEAACQHLRDLYKMYNDWFLALAAYNAGPGNVNRAIRRAGGATDFWEIKRFLPRETQGYIPAFIAVNYVFRHAGDHYIKPGYADIPMLESDTVLVKRQLRFDQVAEVLGVSKDILELMNPAYRRGIIPASEKRFYTMYLPKNKVPLFLLAERTIYDYKTRAEREMEERLAAKYGPVKQGTHRVLRGQSLGGIASKYGVDVNDIREWNNLSSNMIHPGDELIIFAPERVLEGKVSPVSSVPTTAQVQDDYIYHTVRKGDTLSEIAEQYPNTSVSTIKRLNNIANDRRLKLGQKLRVAPVAG